jgi:hypothetical protein
MPRRNRNAGAARLDCDQFAADLDQLTADLHCTALTGSGKTTIPARYLARAVKPGDLLTVIDGKQPMPEFTPESR